MKLIRHARFVADLSLREVAERCGIAISSLADIERGRRPSLQVAVRLAQALKLDAAEVIAEMLQSKLDESGLGRFKVSVSE